MLLFFFFALPSLTLEVIKGKIMWKNSSDRTVCVKLYLRYSTCSIINTYCLETHTICHNVYVFGILMRTRTSFSQVHYFSDGKWILSKCNLTFIKTSEVEKRQEKEVKCEWVMQLCRGGRGCILTSPDYERCERLQRRLSWKRE